MCLCVCVPVWKSGQLETLVLSFPPWRVLGLNSGHPSCWQQAPYPTEPFCWPWSGFLAGSMHLVLFLCFQWVLPAVVCLKCVSVSIVCEGHFPWQLSTPGQLSLRRNSFPWGLLFIVVGQWSLSSVPFVFSVKKEFPHIPSFQLCGSSVFWYGFLFPHNCIPSSCLSFLECEHEVCVV